MARQRRGGFPAPELRGTLGTLLRTTREVLERGARHGRERLDEALASRRREDALAELGEIVLDLVRRGEIDLQELPEARDVIAQLDDLDSRTSSRDQRDHQDEPAMPAMPAMPAERQRFDERRGKPTGDGTVSAATKRVVPPTAAKVPERVWRPPGAGRPNAAIPAPASAAPASPLPTARGGIAFDDDLEDYMHPDDLPAKPAPGKPPGKDES